MAEVSGAHWCARFPTSARIADLVQPFQNKVWDFHGVLLSAGARVTVSATLRPKERGYLMNGAWRIARELAAPTSIGPMAGVEIDWTHGGDVKAARAAAAKMVATYGLAYRPSLTSRHYEGRAIDWTITWTGTLNIRNRVGTIVAIMSEPKNGNTNRELHAIGASFGVHKLLSDPPHWSDDGR